MHDTLVKWFTGSARLSPSPISRLYKRRQRVRWSRERPGRGISANRTTRVLGFHLSPSHARWKGVALFLILSDGSFKRPILILARPLEFGRHKKCYPIPAQGSFRMRCVSDAPPAGGSVKEQVCFGKIVCTFELVGQKWISWRINVDLQKRSHFERDLPKTIPEE